MELRSDGERNGRAVVLKLIVVEPESEALLQALDSRADRVSSVLASVEVHRSLRRLRAPRAARERAAAILSAVVMVSGRVLHLRPPACRLARAATARGLAVLHPGVVQLT